MKDSKRVGFFAIRMPLQIHELWLIVSYVSAEVDVLIVGCSVYAYNKCLGKCRLIVEIVQLRHTNKD